MTPVEDSVHEIETKPYYPSALTIAAEWKRVLDSMDGNAESAVSPPIRWEYDLFSLTGCTLARSSERRFSPMVAWSNGVVWPDPDAFNADAAEYFAGRLDTSSNAFLKARYADFLFEFGPKLTGAAPFPVAQQLVPILIETGVQRRVNGDFHQALDDLARAAEVAMKMRNADLLGLVVNALGTNLEALQTDHHYRWVVDASEILRGVRASKLAKHLPEGIVARCLEALDEAATAVDGWIIRVHVCNEIIAWKRTQSATEEVIRGLEASIGEVYEDHARTQSVPMVKAHFLEMALTQYIQKGMADREDSLKAQIKEAYREAQANAQTGLLTIPLPSEVVEHGVADRSFFLVDDMAEAVTKLAHGDCLYPSVSDVAKVSEDQRHLAPLASMMARSVIADGKKVFQTTTEDDVEKATFAANYMLGLALRTQTILVPVLQRLMQDKGLTAEHVLERLQSWPLFPPDNYDLVADGVRKFFAQDYIGCLHILAPQLESTLRRAFESKGYATTSMRAGGTQHEETFNAFLQRTDVRAVLGEDLHRVIEMTMVDPLGLNLRNEVAHGLILADKCNEVHCAQIMMLFLALTTVDIPDPTDPT